LAKQSAAIVSFNDESLILVNSDDEIIGYTSKDKAHNGVGLLHRAFSLFIFNSRGELLLQQRAQNKRLWGGYWSNSVCSHPRQGEDLETATQRRLQEELGLSCPLQFLYKFEYQATFSDQGAENELCSVFIGHYESKTAQTVTVNSNEIAAWRWITASPKLHPLVYNGVADSQTRLGYKHSTNHQTKELEHGTGQSIF